MIIAEVMNRNVKTIRPDDTVMDAVKVMNENRIGSLVVIDGTGKLVGIITERTILAEVVAKNKNSKKTKVEDIMATEVVTVAPEMTLEEAADLMCEKNIKKLPVIDKGELVGIVTASDLVAYESKLIDKVGKLLLTKSMQGFGG